MLVHDDREARAFVTLESLCGDPNGISADRQRGEDINAIDCGDGLIGNSRIDVRSLNSRASEDCPSRVPDQSGDAPGGCLGVRDTNAESKKEHPKHDGAE